MMWHGKKDGIALGSFDLDFSSDPMSDSNVDAIVDDVSFEFISSDLGN